MGCKAGFDELVKKLGLDQEEALRAAKELWARHALASEFELVVVRPPEKREEKPELPCPSCGASVLITPAAFEGITCPRCGAELKLVRKGEAP